MFKLTWASGIVWILLPSSVPKHMFICPYEQDSPPSCANEQIYILQNGRISVWVLFTLHLNQYKISLGVTELTILTILTNRVLLSSLFSVQLSYLGFHWSFWYTPPVFLRLSLWEFLINADQCASCTKVSGLRERLGVEILSPTQMQRGYGCSRTNIFS